jgi:hypothetical protein
MHIYCVYKSSSPLGSPRVLALKIHALQPFSLYDRYSFIWGANSKIQKIPKHQWFDKREVAVSMLLRVVRLIQLVDATGLEPLAAVEVPVKHNKIRKLETTADHMTWWQTKTGSPVVFVEPNHGRSEIEAEIQTRGLAAFTIKKGVGIYEGCTDGLSVVIGNHNCPELMEIRQKIGALKPIETQEGMVVQEMPFIDALCKTKQMGVAKDAIHI